LVVFKLRFLERVTVIVITAGHFEAFPRCSRRRQSAVLDLLAVVEGRRGGN
jgi:hypothetical protein